jgi:ketosteroid isomerase-like protein
MAADRLELVKQGYEAWNRGDRTWVLAHMSPDVEWITPPEDLDRGTYRGHDGVEEFWAQWRASVGQLGFEIEEVEEVAGRVVVTARRSGKGEHSGLEISDSVLQVFEFDGDTCVRVHEHYDRASALREIGVEELA